MLTHCTWVCNQHFKLNTNKGLNKCFQFVKKKIFSNKDIKHSNTSPWGSDVSGAAEGP